MITIICGTDRKDSMTSIVANHVFESVKEKTTEVQYLTLNNLPTSFYASGHYNPDNHNDEMNAMQDQYFINAEKLIIISPEYNGSYPGVLKHLIDLLSVRKYKDTFSGKKAALIGVAAGRAGNLRGLDHLADSLMHMGVFVYPNKLPLSSIKGSVDGGSLKPDSIQAPIDQIIEGFINF